MTACCLALLSIGAAAPAPGVYVDGLHGSDSNPGSFERPWKTLAKLSTAKLADIAGIYLACGLTYRERLVLSSAQLRDGAVIAGYGHCSPDSKAVISGADDFSGGWTKTGSIWSRHVPAATPKIVQLFVDGVAQRTAQYPNYGGLGHEYSLASAASPASKTALLADPADLATLSARDILGAGIYVREEPWYTEKRTVAAFDKRSGAISFDKPMSYDTEGGDGYVLTDKQWMLDAPGEFFHDSANGMLYVYPGGAAPQASLNAALVEGSVRANAVDISRRANLVMRDIAAVKTTTEAMSLSNVSGMRIGSIEVSDNAAVGLRITDDSEGATIQSSRFERNAYRAIDTQSARVSCRNNSIIDTGMVAYAGGSAPALTIGDGGIADGNIVRRSAYTGINYSGTGGSQVTRNVVEDSCLRQSDGAAIYSWNGGGNTKDQSSLIENNFVARAPGNGEGAAGGYGDSCNGIYADDLSLHGIIRGNTVMDVPIGIYLHNASHMTVESNKVWLARTSGIVMNMDHTDRDTMVGNVIRDNQFNVVPVYSGDYPRIPATAKFHQGIEIRHESSGAGAVTSGANRFSGNVQLILSGDSPASALIGGAGIHGVSRLSPAAWRGMNPDEPPPKSPATYESYVASLGPELISNGRYANGAHGWRSWFAAAASSGRMKLTTASGCAADCMLFGAGTVYDVLASPSFTLKPGALYLLTLHASLQSDGALSPPNVAAGTDMVSATNLSGASGDSIDYRGFFIAKSSAASSVNLSAQAGTQVGFDSVSLKQVTGYVTAETASWAAYLYAGWRESPKVVNCAVLGWPEGCKVIDANGAAITLPITMAPGNAQLLLRADSPLRVKAPQGQ